MGGDENNHPVLLCLLGSFRLLRHGELVALRSGGKTEAVLTRLWLPARAALGAAVSASNERSCSALIGWPGASARPLLVTASASVTGSALRA